MTTISPQDHDDALLTAYALNELPDHQRADIDRMLASGTPAALAAQAEIARIRDLGVLVTRSLEAELAAAGVPALSAAQRAAIARAARPRRPVPWRLLGAVTCAALAAGLMILVGIPSGGGPASAPPPVAIAPASSSATDVLRSSASALARREERTPVEQAERQALDAKGALAEPPVTTRTAAMAQSPKPSSHVRAIQNATDKDAADKDVRDQDAVASTVADAANKKASAPAPVRESAKTQAGAVAPASAANGAAMLAAAAAPVPAPASPLRSAHTTPSAGPVIAETSAAPTTTPAMSDGALERAPFQPAAAVTPLAAAAAGPGAGPRRLASADTAEDGPLVLTEHAPRAAVPLAIGSSTLATIRRCLAAGRLPPPAAVDLADLINDVPGQDLEPSPGESVAIAVGMGPCPWDKTHQLASIRLRAIQPHPSASPPVGSTMVLLIDASGAMRGDDRLALITRAAERLLTRLEPADRLTILTVADHVRVLGEHSEIDAGAGLPAALAAVSAGGEADLGDGLARAAEIVRAHLRRGGANSIVVCTAGGSTSAGHGTDALVATARGLAQDGIALHIMAVGLDHPDDRILELLAHQRSATYAYLATTAEAEQRLASALRLPAAVVAHAATMEVAFDPARISAYRLLGARPLPPGTRAPAEPAVASDLIDQEQVVTLVELAFHADAGGAGGTSTTDSPALAEKRAAPALMTVTVRYQDRSGAAHVPVIARLADARTGSPGSGDLPLIAAMAEFGLALRHPDDHRFSWVRMEREVRSAAPRDGVFTDALLDAIRSAAAVCPVPARP